MTDELKTLMVHVERIVRPVRAGTRRRMRMRRELLAHLQAAVAEEREAGGTEEEILERAKVRLGERGELMRELQGTVPMVERFCFGRWPMPKWLERWENRLEKYWGVLTCSEGAAVVAAGIMLALVSLTMALYVPRDRADAFFAMDTQGRGRYLTDVVAGVVVAELLFVMVIALMGRALRPKWRRKSLFICAGAVAVLEALWILLVDWQVLGKGMDLMEVTRAVGMGVGLVVVLVAVARGMGRVIVNQGREWRMLDISE